jgi:hypothetical protein
VVKYVVTEQHTSKAFDHRGGEEGGDDGKVGSGTGRRCEYSVSVSDSEVVTLWAVVSEVVRGEGMPAKERKEVRH